jgi:hypothetical protein
MTLRTLGALVALVVVLGGCAQYDAVISDNAVRAADTQYTRSLALYCRANSTGKMLRMSKEERDAFITYCRTYALD